MSKWQHKQQPSLVLGSTVEGGSPVTLTGIDFERHKWLSGVSGSGKSTLIAWIAVSLLRQDIPFLIIDPHGSLAKLILSLLASSDFFRTPRADRLWYVDFHRSDAAIAFNILKQSSVDTHTIASNLLEAIHRAFPTTGTTANLDNVLLAASYVLAKNNKPLTHLSKLLLDATYRDILMGNIAHPDPAIVQFFKSKFAEKVNSQLIDSSLRRSFLLTFSPVLQHTVGQKENKVDFRSLIENRMSCIFSLGGLSDYDKRFLGCLLLVSLEQTFLSKTDISSEKKTPVHVIVDEAPLFFSQSETSFTNMLEQCRKAGATIYYAFQTFTQLSKGMAGSLGNALPIIMKASVDDSSALVSRFYRPIEQKPTFFDLFGFSRPSPGLFDNVKNMQQARMIFEHLQRQEAIVMVADKPVKIMTPTLPVKIDQQKLAEIETMYARRLLTPLAHIEREQTASNLVVVSSAPASNVPVAKRRVASSLALDGEPVQIITGVLDTDLLVALYHFHYLTLSQIVKLLDREKNINHVRTKLKKLVEDDLIETTTLARASSGKPPTVYFLTAKGIKRVADTSGVPARLPAGEKKHGYLDHSLECSDMLIASMLLPKVEPTITLVDLKHERTLKNTPCKLSDGVYLVPDGWVHLRHKNEPVGICFEVDRSTEDKEKIQAKLQNYVTFASGIYQQTFGLESLTIAFCVTDGAQKRVKQLVTWAEQTLQNNRVAASFFLFGSVTPGAIDPQSLFLDATFLTPYESTPRALVETP